MTRLYMQLISAHSHPPARIHELVGRNGICVSPGELAQSQQRRFGQRLVALDRQKLDEIPSVRSDHLWAAFSDRGQHRSSGARRGRVIVGRLLKLLHKEGDGRLIQEKVGGSIDEEGECVDDCRRRLLESSLDFLL